MTDWLNVMPEGGPERVEQARAAAQALVDRIPEDRTALEAARGELTKAEQHDRQQLADAMRAGEEGVSDTKAITRARDAVGATERRLEARRLAAETAQQELGAEIRASRSEWLRTAEQAAEKARSRARKALQQLETELDALRRARITAWWLEPGNGLDREQRTPHGHLGVASSSATAMANKSPVPPQTLLSWVAELVDPPAPRTMPQAEPQPLQPVQFGAYVGER